MSDFPKPDPTVLAVGIRWLYDTEQPGGAIIQHHGTGIGYAPVRGYGFCPDGARGLPVVSVNALGWTQSESRIVGGLGAGEMSANAAALASLGVEVREQWNGDGYIHGSFGLVRPAHPSLLAAVARYHAGCPVHKTVFCGWQGSTEAERACTWYADGNRLIVGPDRPVPAEAESSVRAQAGEQQ